MNPRPKSCRGRIRILFTRDGGEAHLRTVHGGAKQARFPHARITAARNERNEKTIKRATCASSRLKTTMIAAKGYRPEGN